MRLERASGFFIRKEVSASTTVRRLGSSLPLFTGLSSLLSSRQRSRGGIYIGIMGGHQEMRSEPSKCDDES